MADVRSNASRVYQTLRQRIIRCEVAPEQKLKIADLAQELDVSPGAVREALSRLSTEHIVVATDQRGFRAAPISIPELEDLTETRVDIETMVLTRAIGNADDPARAAIRKAEAAMTAYAGPQNSAEAAHLHGQFHDALVRACGSPTLLRIRSSLYEVSQRYRYFAVQSVQVERNVADEHRRISDAVVSGDTARACAEMTDHIRRTSDIVKSALTLAATEPHGSDSRQDLDRALALPTHAMG